MIRRPHYYPVNRDGLVLWLSSRLTGAVAASGTWGDYSGIAADATLAVNAYVDGSGVNLDGSSYASGSDAAFPTDDGEKTISFWANPTSFDSYRIAFWYGTAGTGQALGVGTSGSNWYATQEGSVMCSAAAASGVWTNIVVTYDSVNEYLLYKNGAFAASGSAYTDTTPGGTFYVGRQYSVGSYYWVGLLDDIQLFSRALSAGEIAQNYQRCLR